MTSQKAKSAKPSAMTDLARYHIWLDKEDAEWFKSMFGEELGFSRSIRTAMRTLRKNIEARAAERQIPKARVMSEEEQEKLLGESE